MSLKSKKNAHSSTTKKPTVLTLKQKINKYIFKRGDICCDDQYKKSKIIKEIHLIYKKQYGKKYLEWIENDLVIFIGFKMDLIGEKDKIGVQVWNNISNITKGKKLNRKNIDYLLNELPLYYILAFLGSIYLESTKTK